MRKLKRPLESVHGNVIYSVDKCQSKTKTHIESVHENIIYPCAQCDTRHLGNGTCITILKQHIRRFFTPVSSVNLNQLGGEV